MSTEKPKTLGQAIDEVVLALEPLAPQARLTAIRAACEHLKIELPNGETKLPEGAKHGNGQSTADSAAAGRITDIKTLKNEKQPRSAIEMACIVGYYLESVAPEGERKSAIKVEDIDKYFRQANFPLPKAMPQLLIDAKASGYFDSAGVGAYKLNPVGYNLVAHSLPRASKPKK